MLDFHPSRPGFRCLTCKERLNRHRAGFISGNASRAGGGRQMRSLSEMIAPLERWFGYWWTQA